MKLIIFILIVLIIAALLIRIILKSVNQHSPLLMQLHAAGIRTGDAERILSAVWFFRTVFPVSVAAAMNPEHMAECDHRIMRSEFPDYRELFRESDIKSAVAFLIFHSPFQCVVAFSSAYVFRFVLVLSERLLVFCPDAHHAVV